MTFYSHRQPEMNNHLGGSFISVEKTLILCSPSVCDNKIVKGLIYSHRPDGDQHYLLALWSKQYKFNVTSTR